MQRNHAGVSYADLKSRVVLVTGGSSGIGAEIVRAFAAQKSVVHFLDLDTDAGETVAAETGAAFHACDLTDIDALRDRVAGIEQAAGPVGVLVNNAGRDDRHDLDEVSPDAWRRALAVNLDHQFFATQAVRRGMASAGGGSVVMLGSVSWMRGRPNMVGYTTAKAAINGLTRTLARELGPEGIRVNCIVPGAIRTERQQKLWVSPERENEFLALQALKFRLEPVDVAPMALFLGSDQSRACTGANFMVDGGLTQN